MRLGVISGLLLALTLPGPAQTKHRVLVSTGLGGGPDDIRSLYRLLHYSGVLEIEGIVSSPGPGAGNSANKVRHWIREIRIGQMRANGYPELITEQRALELVRQGRYAKGAPSPAGSTEGFLIRFSYS